MQKSMIMRIIKNGKINSDLDSHLPQGPLVPIFQKQIFFDSKLVYFQPPLGNKNMKMGKKYAFHHPNWSCPPLDKHLMRLSLYTVTGRHTGLRQVEGWAPGL